MKVLPPPPIVLRYIKKRRIEKKYGKQIRLLALNFRHPGLHTELLEPKHFGIYSFRIDRKYRGMFVFLPEEQAIKIVDVNDHYQR